MAQPTPPPYQPADGKVVTASGQPLPPSGIPGQIADVAYQNNPFMVAIDGLGSLFKYAKAIAIVFIILSALGIVGNAASSVMDMVKDDQSQLHSSSTNPSDSGISPDFAYEQVVSIAAIVGGVFLIMLLIAIVVWTIIAGLRDIAAAAIVRQEEISFKQAVSKLMNRFSGYLGLQILIFVKVFLWSLLFIIPGIVMAVRYSLAGTAYFARDMKAGDALRHSTAITKDGWMTTFASIGLFNLITLGTISLLIQASVQGVLFRQFDAYNRSKIQKPGAHGLSIAFVVIYCLLMLLFVLALLMAVAWLGMYLSDRG